MKNPTALSGLGLTAVPPALHTCSRDRDGRDGACSLGLPEVAKRRPRGAHRAFVVFLVLVGSVTAAAALGSALQSRPVLEAR
jgi:hypothetical protein